MTIRSLRPWSDHQVKFQDVERGTLNEAVFTIDLGAIVANNPNVPVVNGDPEGLVPEGNSRRLVGTSGGQSRLSQCQFLQRQQNMFQYCWK